MTDSLLLVILAAVALLGALVGAAGFRWRSWALVLIGAVMCSMPAGFASVMISVMG